ncbi:MAG: IS1634 family transposase [Rhodococcus sp.]|uniref:IS1634 family transposase n=1 Tax=Rhodococcus sp. TaxID=1831 RepID=UPI0016BCBE3B|nr:IS1634 family transposase [Rhodococcus sp. (in: high G+C Gram-positive bacteria)]NLV81291.1 IS1634 family transposase [Rhodococcus sp. (in: high G+C Gram-positive bacteria)]
MAAYIRKVRTASGATAVQIAAKQGRRDKVLEHLGSAHTDSELAALLETAREKLLAGQQQLDLDLGTNTGGASMITGKRSRWLIEVIDTAWRRLGFDVIDNEAFFQLVAARIVEATSVADTGRVLGEIGIAPAHRNTFVRTLRRCTAHGYRDHVAQRCFEHAAAAGDLNLLLYDVTTLYFEAEKEDDLRKVGFSKERRVDPQIVVGLLVDRNGFPLEIGCFEGNHAETHTIVPIVRQFQKRHDIEGVEMVIAADAGMLSAANLKDLDAAGLKFIVGSRVMKAPSDLASHFHWNGDVFTDGQVIDTVTPRHAKSVVNDIARRAEPVWEPADTSAWRAIWAYSTKRAVRDNQTLNAQEERAKSVIDGTRAARSPRFVKTTTKGKTLDTDGIARARSLVGLKGYVSNVPVSLMNPREVMTKYHDLWQVEQSFRMSKTDLRARPIFSHKRDSIEAHLTIVFAALAISRYLQAETGMSIRKIVRSLRPLQEITVTIAGHEHTALDPLTDDAASILDSLEIPNPRSGLAH